MAKRHVIHILNNGFLFSANADGANYLESDGEQVWDHGQNVSFSFWVFVDNDQTTRQTIFELVEVPDSNTGRIIMDYQGDASDPAPFNTNFFEIELGGAGGALFQSEFRAGPML